MRIRKVETSVNVNRNGRLLSAFWEFPSHLSSLLSVQLSRSLVIVQKS